jgi:hypothetical protein
MPLDTNVVPSIKLDLQQRLAIALAGTVALPSPHPACGTVSVGLCCSGRDELPSGSPRYYVKSVENVSSRQVVTRIVALNDLRAVSCPEGDAAADPKAPRVAQPVEDLFLDGGAISAAKQKLEAAVKRAPGDYEIGLFPVAVLHVPETAPVLVRVVFEAGVTAAEAAVIYSIDNKGICCI